MFNKKNINLLLSCTIFFVSVYSYEQKYENQIYADLFQQANDLYKQGKFEEALTLYKKIPDGGAIVHYNMGNCAFKLGDHGYALAYWRRAERIWGLGGGLELLNNIKLLKNKICEVGKIREDKHKDDAFLQEIKNLKLSFDFFVHSTPLVFFQIVFLLIWILIFIFIRYLFKSKRKTLIPMLFTILAIFGLILVVKYNFEIKQHGVVVSKNARLLSGPGQSYQVLSFVPETSELVIEKTVDGFFKVKVNGQMGWMNQSSVEKF